MPTTTAPETVGEYIIERELGRGAFGVVYHAVHGDTTYPGTGGVRAFYLAMLASHVLLSAVALPLTLTAFFFAFRGSFAKHRKVVKFALPIWLYVSVTGVAIYLMLRAAGAVR